MHYGTADTKLITCLVTFLGITSAHFLERAARSITCNFQTRIEPDSSPWKIRVFLFSQCLSITVQHALASRMSLFLISGGYRTIPSGGTSHHFYCAHSGQRGQGSYRHAGHAPEQAGYWKKKMMGCTQKWSKRNPYQWLSRNHNPTMSSQAPAKLKRWSPWKLLVHQNRRFQVNGFNTWGGILEQQAGK